MEEQAGRAEDRRKKEHRDEYGEYSYTYHVTVRFEAEDAKKGTRVMALKACVSYLVWDGLMGGESVRIRYASEDPRIAHIQGEW